MRSLILLAVLLLAWPVSAEPILLGDGMWQSGSADLSNLQQTVSAGDMTVAFDYNWERHVRDDGHETVFGFADASILIRNGLQSWLPEDGMTGMSLHVWLLPAGFDVPYYGDHATHFVSAGFSGQAYQPNDTFELSGESIQMFADVAWRASLSFTGSVQPDASGLGHGTIQFTRVPEPSAILLLTIGLIGIATYRRP